MSSHSQSVPPSPLERGSRLADHWTIGARWANFGDLHLHAGTSEIDVDIAAWRYQGSQPLPKFLEDLDEDRQHFTALVHPQLCRTFDIGRVSDTLTCFWVQESPGGVPLLQHLHERSVVVPDLTVQLGLQIAFGIDAIHRAGLLHGDLDPEFIRVLGKERIKLSWAGLSRRIEASGLDAGRGSSRSLAEVAPETLRDGIVERASDIYGFAALLYRMLTGTSPFLVRRDGPPPGLDPSEALDRLPSAVPSALRPPLTASLGRDPARRPTIEEWIDALRLAEDQLTRTMGNYTESTPRRDRATDAAVPPTRTVPSSSPAGVGSQGLRIDSTIGNVPRSGRTGQPAVPRAGAEAPPPPSAAPVSSNGTVRPRLVSVPPTPPPSPTAIRGSGPSLASLLAATTLMALVVLGGVAILANVDGRTIEAAGELVVPGTTVSVPSLDDGLPAIVTLSTHPPGATVYEAETLLGTTPMEVVLSERAYEEPRVFRIELEGYASHTVRQPWTDNDKQHDIVMQAVTPVRTIVVPAPTWPRPPAPPGATAASEDVPSLREDR